MHISTYSSVMQLDLKLYVISTVLASCHGFLWPWDSNKLSRGLDNLGMSDGAKSTYSVSGSGGVRDRPFSEIHNVVIVFCPVLAGPWSGACCVQSDPDGCICPKFTDHCSSDERDAP